METFIFLLRDSQKKRMNPKALSLQEEEELIRGNKKIEDRHHASFKKGENANIGPRLD